MAGANTRPDRVWNPSKRVNHAKHRDCLVLRPLPGPGRRLAGLRGVAMADVGFVALTIVVFAIVGLVVRGVERL